MVLKPQDIFISLKLLVLDREPWSYVKLAHDLAMSASEINAGVKRCLQVGLLVQGEKGKSPYVNRKAMEEFLVHGVKYAFPPELGAPVRGMRTMFAAEPVSEAFVFDENNMPVWPYAKGKDRGPSFSPLYKSVPEAAERDGELYELLVLVDLIRGGRARERKLGEKRLHEWLSR